MPPRLTRDNIFVRHCMANHKFANLECQEKYNSSFTVNIKRVPVELQLFVKKSYYKPAFLFVAHNKGLFSGYRPYLLLKIKPLFPKFNEVK